MQHSRYFLLLSVGFMIIFSGCVSDPEQNGQVVQVTSDHQDKIDELETRINSMQQDIIELQTRMDRVDLLEPSDNNLIPPVPFKIRVYLGKMVSPITYTFNENGEVEITQDDEFERARYRLLPETNTIEINSNIRDYSGLVLYDEYITGVYDNGWIAWVYPYQIIPIEK